MNSGGTSVTLLSFALQDILLELPFFCFPSKVTLGPHFPAVQLLDRGGLPGHTPRDVSDG